MRWNDILKETGFTERGTFLHLYSILSNYAHSEGLSALQLAYDPEGGGDIQKLAFLDLHHSKILVCLMIESINTLYPEVLARFTTLPEPLQYDIEIYALMGKARSNQ